MHNLKRGFSAAISALKNSHPGAYSFWNAEHQNSPYKFRMIFEIINKVNYHL